MWRRYIRTAPLSPLHRLIRVNPRVESNRRAGGRRAAAPTVASPPVTTHEGDGNQADDGGPRAILVASALAIAVTAILFGPVASRAAADPARAARTALVVAGVAMLSVLLFFTGLPRVVGPAAAYLGRKAEIRR